MDYKLDWTLRARADLREIVVYIDKDNPSAALAWGDDLFRHVEILTNFPSIGPLVRAASIQNTRRIVFGDYPIFYQVHSQRKIVEIVAVWHASRRPPEFL